MFAKPFLIVSAAGVLGFMALGVLLQPEPQVSTLENGLGPEVVASNL